MNKIFLSIMTTITLALGIFIPGNAETDLTEINLSPVESYKIEIGNYSAEISIPEINGMLDTAEQSQINQAFSDHAAENLTPFIEDAKSIHAEYPTDGPHFLWEYKYETLYENADYLVFRMAEFTVAGSSNSSAQYFTLDKNSRSLVTLDQFYAGNQNYMTELRTYIEEEMGEANQTGEMQYWVDEAPGETDAKTAMDQVFNSLEDNRQYYLNQDGQILIAFNKYDVGPGAMGTPEFVIPEDIGK